MARPVLAAASSPTINSIQLGLVLTALAPPAPNVRDMNTSVYFWLWFRCLGWSSLH